MSDLARLLSGLPWQPMPRLSNRHMCKHVIGQDGYTLLLTDCATAWLEQRTESYVAQKAQEWAECLEGGSEKIASLVLGQLVKGPKESPLTATHGDSSLSLQLQATLGDSPYRWEFQLQSISADQMHFLVTVPLAVSLAALHNTVRQQQQQLLAVQQRLRDVLPGGEAGTVHREERWRQESLATACKEVLEGGTAAILSARLEAEVEQQILAHRSGIAVQPKKVQTVTKKQKITGGRKKLVASAQQKVVAEPVRLTEEEQQKRREQLNSAACSQPISVAPGKKQPISDVPGQKPISSAPRKKPKLNI